MKLVREYINEKFTEDSDPIHDMSIGSDFVRIKSNDVIKLKHSITKEKFNSLFNCNFIGAVFSKNIVGIIKKVSKNKLYLHLDVAFFNKPKGIKYSLQIFNSNIWAYTHLSAPLEIYEKYMKVLDLNTIKECLNEKFTEDSDPIHDMGIGLFIKRDFNSEEDFHVFLANNITHILKVNKLPKVFILATDSYSSCSMRSKYSDIINKYIDRYVTINGEKKSDFRLFSISKLAKKLKEGVRKSTKEEVENSNNLLTEKFVEDSDPVHDMGIGLPETIKLSIKNIIKEDKKNQFIIGAGPGNIHYIHITGAVGRGQQHRTGTYFNINFYSNTLYSPVEKYKNGNPKRIHRVSYASELVEKAGISVCFYDVASKYQAPYIIKFKIKPEYRKFFIPGTYLDK